MDAKTKNGGAATGKLNEDKLWDLALTESDIEYRPVPDSNKPNAPIWRVRFDPTFSPTQRFGLDVNGEAVLGRGDDGGTAISLMAFDAEELGVSRRHAMLRPTETKLYIIDLGSTNGTQLNGHSIGVNAPYSLSNGDLLTLGKLEFVVRIIKRPVGQSAALRPKNDLIDVLLPVAKAITSQLTVEEVLKQTLDMTVTQTGVDEASVWLVDENSGELFLEAERGIEDGEIRRMRLSVADTMAGKVIATGKPVRANRADGGNQIKVKTGYLVEAVLYVPLTLGGVTFGVLAAVHHAVGKSLDNHDEKVVAAIADFAAIAVQNARVYEAISGALTRRNKIVTALNSTLAFDMKKLVNSSVGFAGLLESYQDLDSEKVDIVNSIVASGGKMVQILDQLIELTTLNDPGAFHFGDCELVDIVVTAVHEMEPAADFKSIVLDFNLMGEPSLFYGDENFLYRSVLNLLDNAIKFSPPDKKVKITLAYSPSDAILRVRDEGPGIPEDQLPELFDKYFRTRSTSGGDTGLGLGLELVRATVEAHRGTIVVRNVDRHGAEFILTLPRKSEADERHSLRSGDSQ